ncbi:MAG: glycosyltransferase [Sphingobacteriales bacterium]|nr:MAG: glycosyltransferase [Sphingobacteriales bacterium]
MTHPPQISIVIPLYNEAQVLPHLLERLLKLLNNSDLLIEVVLVDDGSADGTAMIAQQIALTDTRFQFISLARNYGQQIALSAGLKAFNATEAIMIMDGDIQDPPEMLTEFYAQLQKGYDVVYAVRENRKEAFIKRWAYVIFYRMLKSISYINIPLDSGDFSMFTRKVADIINKMPEESRFIRGMRTWVGLNQIGISYNREERAAGTSKYTLKKLFKLAYNGIFNFSEFPVKLITNLGLITISCSLIYFAYNVYKKLVLHAVPEGFTALLFTIILFSGVQLLSLGIIGEYVLRIFFQVKGRPLFIVKKRIINQEISNNSDL